MSFVPQRTSGEAVRHYKPSLASFPIWANAAALGCALRSAITALGVTFTAGAFGRVSAVCLTVSNEMRIPPGGASCQRDARFTAAQYGVVHAVFDANLRRAIASVDASRHERCRDAAVAHDRRSGPACIALHRTQANASFTPAWWIDENIRGSRRRCVDGRPIRRAIRTFVIGLSRWVRSSNPFCGVRETPMEKRSEFLRCYDLGRWR